MKIESLQISNVLSFKHVPDINDAQPILFDAGLNILIGQNGAGKSTVLEIINVVFKKILFLTFRLQYDQYLDEKNFSSGQRRSFLTNHDHNPGGLSIYRLNPNWHTPNLEQQIRMKVVLEQVDHNNMKLLEENKIILQKIADEYSRHGILNFSPAQNEIILDIKFKFDGSVFVFDTDTNNTGLMYLRNYHLYNKLIEIHNNSSKPENIIQLLAPTFALISGYRNYHAFTPVVSLASSATRQIQDIQINDMPRGTNSVESNEPSIFNLVRLRIAGLHHATVWTNKSEPEAEVIANNEPFLKAINEKLALINLEVKIKLINRNSWAYSFQFFDTKRFREIGDINALSAGQKAIIHLVFEAYGRGDINGGVIVIDEPELHLHYQFQYEYLRIIKQLNKSQRCQYILVTHSEALITSETIDKVKRLALDSTGSTVVFAPTLQADQKTLVKILDNTKSVYSFFSKKVVMVEGDSDRYFFTAIFKYLYPSQSQEISIIDIGGKGNFKKWKTFFESFGLQVYYIGDFDNVFTIKVNAPSVVTNADKEQHNAQLKQHKLDSMSLSQKQELRSSYDKLISNIDFLTSPKRDQWKPFLDTYLKLSAVKEQEVVASVKQGRPDIQTWIDTISQDQVFILKHGMLEDYASISKKDLSLIIEVSENIGDWLAQNNEYTKDVKEIVSKIAI